MGLIKQCGVVLGRNKGHGERKKKWEKMFSCHVGLGSEGLNLNLVDFPTHPTHGGTFPMFRASLSSLSTLSFIFTTRNIDLFLSQQSTRHFLFDSLRGTQ